MITLDIGQISRLHEKLLEATGGLKGMRDMAMLESALSAPFQTFDGVELYPCLKQWKVGRQYTKTRG